MHLQRVQVPDFRVLKDIDITFEKDFFPRIFPLGSLNGGGKSTLLQLIFILLQNLKFMRFLQEYLNSIVIIFIRGLEVLMFPDHLHVR